MVSSVQDEVASDKSEQRKIEDSIAHESQSNLDGNTTTHSELPRKESGNVQDEPASGKLGQRRIEDSIAHESQFNLEGNTTTHSELPRKESGNVQRTENVVNDEQLNQSSDCIKGDPACQSSQKRTLLLESLQQGQSTDITSGEHTFETKKKGNPLSVEVAEVSDNLQQRQSYNIGVHGSQYSKGGSRLSSPPEKVPDQEPEPSLNTGLHMLQCDHQVRTFSRIPDKPLEDGYNWRKYGQKLVKGNEYVRSYYRCTHPNCAAKRQVERSQDGQISDTVYLGKHEHIKPQTGSQKAVSCISPIPAIRPDECSWSMEDDLSSNAHVPTSHEAKPMDNPQLPSISPTDNVLDCSNLQPNVTRDGIENNGDPHSKRQKRDMCDADETSVEKPNGEPRVVVQTMSEVDILNDGYRWRKYGQKLVKGNHNPRSYYRCSSAGCPVKKHVERASHDPKVVIITYEGQHDHDMPPARTVTANRGGANANMTDLEDGTTSKPDEKSAVGLEMVVHISAN